MENNGLEATQYNKPKVPYPTQSIVWQEILVYLSRESTDQSVRQSWYRFDFKLKNQIVVSLGMFIYFFKYADTSITVLPVTLSMVYRE